MRNEKKKSPRRSTASKAAQQMMMGGMPQEEEEVLQSPMQMVIHDFLRDKIAMTACKHAVKGGETLSESERTQLFARMGGDMGLRCPHGRPVAVKLTKYEVEKLFKRIV